MENEKQIAVNRANALCSNGPKMEKGKAANSKNAFKNGALRSIAVAEHEDAALFESKLVALVKEHGPIKTIKNQLV